MCPADLILNGYASHDFNWQRNVGCDVQRHFVGRNCGCCDRNIVVFRRTGGSFGRDGLRSGSVSRILPLAWLAPDISTAILEGRQPPHLNSKALRNLADLPLSWEEQRQILGFPPL